MPTALIKEEKERSKGRRRRPRKGGAETGGTWPQAQRQQPWELERTLP